MQLSRLGQGLAVSAVSALAITGLAVTASPALAVDGAGVVLLSQLDGVASVRYDDDSPDLVQGTSVTLTAEQVDPAATISFEFNADPTAGDASGGWTAVASPITAEPGYASTEWFPAADLVGTAIALRAVATVAATGDSPETATFSTRNDVALEGQDSSVNSVAIQSGGSFFTQPYLDSSRTDSFLLVEGTTSASEGNVELSAWSSTDGTFHGTTDAAVSLNPLKVGTGGGGLVIGGYFSGSLDISAFDAEEGDVLAVRAERDSDSVVPLRLEEQTITSIESFADMIAGPETTRVALRVVDQDGAGIFGAEVRRSSDGALVGYTKDDGMVEVDQANSTTESYYANSTDTDAFEDDVDVETSPVVTSAYVPVAAATKAILADGTVFDDKEYAAGDIALQVVDHRGEPFATETELAYSIVADGQEETDRTLVTTDEGGRVELPFDPAVADGGHTLTFTSPDGEDDEEPVRFVAGDAVLGLTPTAGTGVAGGEIVYGGTLMVEGQPLAGRDIDLGYTRGLELAPGTEADASLVVDGAPALAGAVRTAADGTFWVTVADRAETGNPAETGGRLKVTARGLQDTVDATADFAARPVATPPAPVPPTADDSRTRLRLGGAKAGLRKDRLRITGPEAIARAEIQVFVKVKGEGWTLLKDRQLNRDGDAKVTVRDHNRKGITAYYVKLRSSVPSVFSKSNVRRIR